MRTLSVFNAVSLDGYFTDSRGDMSWAHQSDPEWKAFGASNSGKGGTLLFGRVTYDMMKGYWPSPAARQNDPKVADGMNDAPKVVFSRTLASADWKNTRLVNGNIEDEVRKMKAEDGFGMVILGSGTIVSQLTAARLIDEYQLVTVPVVLGSGRTLFDGVKDRAKLVLKSSRTFSNGNIVSTYALGE